MTLQRKKASSTQNPSSETRAIPDEGTQAEQEGSEQVVEATREEETTADLPAAEPARATDHLDVHTDGVDEPEVTTDDDAPPIVVEAPPSSEYVVPVRTQSCRIGPGWYSFTAGVRCLVPSEIVDHLKNVGIV